MSSNNPWDQKQVLSIDTTSGISPSALPNWRGRLVPFQRCPLPVNNIEELHSENQQMLQPESSTNQSILSVARQLLESQSKVIQGLHPVANQFSLNEPNAAHDSNLLQHQLSSSSHHVFRALHPPTDQIIVNQSNTIYLQQRQQSSEYAQMIKNFNSITYQPFLNESNISQQYNPLRGQLPSSAIKPNLNTFNQQLAVNMPQFRYPSPCVPSLSEFIRNQERYQSDHQQSERECRISPSTDRLGMPNNQHIPIQQSVGTQDSNPLTANMPIPKMEFNLNQESPMSNLNLSQNLYPQYSEKVHIVVIGPPGCGKADLIRTFGQNDNILIPTNKQLSKVCQQGLVKFGTTFKIDIWYADDLTSVVDDLRSLCESSKSAIVLVYSISQESTLMTVTEWIKCLKNDIAVNVPILLVGNTTDAASRETIPNDFRFSDGARAKEEYDLAGYYEFSNNCVKEAEIIFVIAAFKAFNRAMKNSGIKSMVLAP